MAIKNRYEYLSGILEALDVEHTEAEVHNNEVWRSKVLDGMGVEHTYDDINQTDLWREKVVEGIGNMSEGGSSDFTLASITLADPNDLGFKMESAFIPEDGESIITEFHTNDATNVNIILYKGVATVRFPDGGIVNTNVSGNATKSGKFITVTGDCTFTIWGEGNDPIS